MEDLQMDMRQALESWGFVLLGMMIVVVSMYASGYYQGRRAVELEAVGRGLGRLEPRGTMGERFVWGEESRALGTSAFPNGNLGTRGARD